MDDILDLLDSNEKPFTEQKEKKPKKVNLWDNENITPIKIDVGLFAKIKKTFAFANFSNKEPIDSDLEDKLVNIAKVLFSKGYTYRYNGDKDDTAAIKMASLLNAKIDVYLPWKKFNEDIALPLMACPNEVGYGIGFKYHKTFMKLPPSIRAITSRDSNILLGVTGTEPVDILLVYNLDGSESITKTTDYKKMGNTVYPIRIAAEANIPVYNIKNEESINRLINFIKSH